MVYSTYPAHVCRVDSNEELALEIIQKTSGLLSIIGSGLIVSDVLRKLYRRLINWTDSYQRIMLGLSFFDFLWSLFLFFGVVDDTTRDRLVDTPWESSDLHGTRIR